MCECPSDVHDRGLTRFDVNELVVDCTIRFGQLVEHLVNEIVEYEFGGVVKLRSNRHCMITAQFGDASCSIWIFRCRNKFVDVDVILVEL